MWGIAGITGRRPDLVRRMSELLAQRGNTFTRRKFWPLLFLVAWYREVPRG